ncbi:somatomedin-B and thrombospondin type-1 domain-containing protein isoform X2 [Coregonus clupeaformis]|uniref:somatomedin-B and thrombospondin type-1 domain-containing protein isoform X2 n=1 Tax=Coregonus clupeaformis TaxID=59861 RepID=UPI001BDFC8B1|nr:somatomedin-B and thrombospondin type-1 domain-containing protein isoform X2 [Coregonus clupeaformis]
MPPFRYTVTGCWIYYCVGLMVFLVAPGDAGCEDVGFCCTGRDPSCISKGWRADRSYGTCYCDQACTFTLDCCHDYELACPAVSCVVSEWSAWSGCAEPCRATVRMRSRQVLQEPQNGGEPCLHVEEHAGCAEYKDHPRQCSKSLVPALITTGGYGNARKKRDIPVKNDDVTGYCVQFQLTSMTPGCQRSVGPHTRWMHYLREGHKVCVECQPPALAAGQRHCSGDGEEEESGRQSLQWQAVGNPRCRGVWRRFGRLDSCSCPTVHSFLFI